MPVRSLVLIRDSYILTLREFLANGYELTLADAGDVEYGLSGSVVDGPAFEPKRVWTIQAPMTRQQWRMLKLIFQRSESIRQQPPNDFSIRVYDYIEPCVEDQTTPSRAVAPEGSVTAIDDGIEYPGQFNVRLFQPKAVPWGNALQPYSVSFVMKELDRVPA